MTKANNQPQAVTECKIRSRVNHNVPYTYDGKACMLAPHQEQLLPNKSLLGAYDPKTVVVVAVNS